MEMSNIFNPSKKHIIDISEKHFDDINKGLRKFEIVPNEMNVNIGDILILKEINSHKSFKVEVVSKHCGEDIGLDERYSILSFEPLKVNKSPLVIATSYSGLKDLYFSNINLNNIKTEFKFSESEDYITCDINISSIDGFGRTIRLHQDNV